MPTTTHIPTLLSAYEAFNARDIQAALELMTPDVQWPNGMEGGYVHGREAVREYWIRQWQQINPHVEPVSFDDAPDGRTIVGVSQVVKDMDGNVVLNTTVQHVYTITGGGLISHMEIK